MNFATETVVNLEFWSTDISLVSFKEETLTDYCLIEKSLKKQTFIKML